VDVVLGRVIIFALLFPVLTGCSGAPPASGPEADLELVEVGVVSRGAFEYSQELITDSLYKWSTDIENVVNESAGLERDSVSQRMSVNVTKKVDRHNESRMCGTTAEGCKARSYIRLDMKGCTDGGPVEWRLSFRSLSVDRAFLLRGRHTGNGRKTVSMFFKKSFASEFLTVFAGDLAPSFSGTLVSRADMFSTVWNKDYPFQKVPCILPHTYSFGRLVRGCAALVKVSPVELVMLSGFIGGFSHGRFNREENISGAIGAVRIAECKVKASIVGHGNLRSESIFALGVDYEGRVSRFALAVASKNNLRIGYELKMRARTESNLVALTVVDKPGGYFSPLGDVMGRRISPQAEQRGVVLVLKNKLGGGCENTAGMERYYRQDLKTYVRTKLFDSFFMKRGRFKILLSFSRAITSSVKGIPVPPDDIGDEACDASWGLSSRYTGWKGVSPRLKLSYRLGPGGEGVLVEQGVSLAVYGGKMRLYQSFAYSLPLSGRPYFYYLSSYFPGNYPWRRISGRVLALNFSCTVRASRVQFSAFIGMDGPSLTGCGFQMLVKL